MWPWLTEWGGLWFQMTASTAMVKRASEVSVGGKEKLRERDGQRVVQGATDAQLRKAHCWDVCVNSQRQRPSPSEVDRR